MKTLLKTLFILSVGLALAAVSQGRAAQLPTPIITASANPFPNGGYPAANLLDNDPFSEYACASQGAVTVPFTTAVNNGTWVEFDFLSPVTLDQFVMMARRNNADVIMESRLIISPDPTFDASDTVITFNPSGQNWHALLHSFSAATGRYVRWEVTQANNPGANLGGAEMWFMTTPPGLLRLPAPTVINSYAPFSGNYLAAFAVNGDAGSDEATDYASAGGGPNMFIDFDFGAPVPIAGFDYWNRPFDVVTSFNLVFADTPDFASPLDTKSFTADPIGNRVSSGTFAAVTARYLRLQATGSSGVNTGVREIQFYTVTGQKPFVTREPQGGTRLIGDTVTLSAGVGGDEPLSFQWWKDSQMVDYATNSSLTLSNLQPDASGSYTLAIHNDFGDATSEPAVLTVIDPPVDITSDLHLWLLLDDGIGSVAHDESLYQDGTLLGFADEASQWTIGMFGGGLSFNPDGPGINEVVLVQDFGQVDFSTNPEFTLSAWVKGPAGQEDSAGLITKGMGGGGEQYALDIYQGRYRFFGRDTSGADVFQAHGWVGPNDTWQHVVGVYSRTLNRLKLYVNAVEVASGTPFSAGLLVTNLDLSIGARLGVKTYDHNLNFKGVMDDVRVYARALTPADVLTLFNEAPPQPPGIAQGPQGGWVLAGNPWTFSVAAYSIRPLSYQWRKNGQAIEGATGAEYLVPSAQRADSGYYTVVVYDDAGQFVESAPAGLDVVSPLDLSSAPVEASSEWYDGNYPASHVFDGLRFSTSPSGMDRWASLGTGVPQWLYVDLGQDMNIRHVLVDWEYAAGRDVTLRVRSDAQGPSAVPEEYLEVASVASYAQDGNGIDGADVVFDCVHGSVLMPGNTDPAATATMLPGGAQGRYLMIYAVPSNPPYYHVSIWEMQVDAEPLPVLTMQYGEGKVDLSWPLSYTDFILETTGTLPADTWSPVPGVIDNHVSVDATGDPQYFRLRTP
jgi:hypothetical protein